jgi:hypothetical protein
MRSRPALPLLPIVALLALAGCTDRESLREAGEAAPPTVFDPAPHIPKDEQGKIDAFILRTEVKYRRESYRNSIDLHFMENGPRRIKVRVTYDRNGDPTTANSIADAALDLVKRLKREDEYVRDISIDFDREVVRREDK